MSLAAGTRLGNYEILSDLGSGGMGEVYKAKDLKLGRDVAIKVLPQEMAADSSRLRRFEQEARAASALNHPNIVTIYEIGEHEGTPFIAMEYVKGETLREILADGPLPNDKLIRYARQMAEGLAKAHQAGIVHRDLKPENVMVTDDGLVKILDFGLAKLMPQSTDADSEMDTVTKATQQGVILGTLQYMSPEQAASRPIDYRSDQFSFGSILYEMATGRLAFKKDTMPQTLAAIIEDEPEPIRKLNVEIPTQLSEIVERCLAKDPNERYESTADLARELKTVPETSPTWLTRRRLLWTAAGLKCTGCGHENAAEAKFCLQCGTKLENLCPQCEKVLPPSARFCNNCGHALADAEPGKPAHESPPRTVGDSSDPPVAEGERRQATVLFSGLSGYTTMSERLDPEEVEGIMSRIKAEAVKIVASHGGIVNQFVGDEVLALFGIPTAHEDDPHRAVRASLELHELVRDISPEVEKKIGAPLRMHSGINTGLIVTHQRDDREGRYGITGDAVNTGARLAAQAREDEILLGPETRRQITPFFETEVLEPVVMKGKTRQMIPHRVVGVSTVQSRFEAAEQWGFTAFIGREGELATLNSCLEKVVAGNGQFVSVVGEAGVGKSRLLYEFRHGLDRDRINVLQGRCQSYGAYTPYQPFINALRQGLRLEEEDTPEELLRKAVANVRAIDEALEEYIPRLPASALHGERRASRTEEPARAGFGGRLPRGPGRHLHFEHEEPAHGGDPGGLALGRRCLECGPEPPSGCHSLLPPAGDGHLPPGVRGRLGQPGPSHAPRPAPPGRPKLRGRRKGRLGGGRAAGGAGDPHPRAHRWQSLLHRRGV